MPDALQPAPPWPAHAVAGEGAVEWTALLLPPGQAPNAPGSAARVAIGSGFHALDRIHLGALEDRGDLLRLQFILERRVDPDSEAAPRDLWFVLGPQIARPQTRRVEVAVQAAGEAPRSTLWLVT